MKLCMPLIPCISHFYLNDNHIIFQYHITIIFRTHLIRILDSLSIFRILNISKWKYISFTLNNIVHLTFCFPCVFYHQLFSLILPAHMKQFLSRPLYQSALNDHKTLLEFYIITDFHASKFPLQPYFTLSSISKCTSDHTWHYSP